MHNKKIAWLFLYIAELMNKVVTIMQVYIIESEWQPCHSSSMLVCNLQREPNLGVLF